MAGSIEKRGENRWRLVVSGGTGPDGKRIKHTKTIQATSRREAEKELAKFVAEVEKGLYVEPSKLTFKDFVERWLRDYGESNLAPKTLFRYRQILSSRVIPAMGHLKLEQIRPVHLIEFYKNLQEDGIREDGKPGGLSAKTILYHHRVISSILNDAVEWQLIPFNPASRVKPPKVQKKQAACYDMDQVKAMLKALETEEPKYRVIVIMALLTGLRRGELMGLTWQDVDFDGGTLMVRQASQYLPGKGTFVKEPKNESSQRLLALPSSLVNILRQYKREQAEHRLKVGDLWQGSDRLFTTWDGQPMHPDTISSWFPKFLKRHGLPHLPFHGLRHTAATLLINKGIPLKNVSGRLGHADVGTTGNIYSHFLQSADRVIADTLDEFYQEVNAR
jgi:integrase